MILPKRCITVRKVADVIFSDDVDDVAEVTVSKIDRDFSGSTFYEVTVTASSSDVVAENVELVTVVKP